MTLLPLAVLVLTPAARAQSADAAFFGALRDGRLALQAAAPRIQAPNDERMLLEAVGKMAALKEGTLSGRLAAFLSDANMRLYTTAGPKIGTGFIQLDDGTMHRMIALNRQHMPDKLGRELKLVAIAAGLADGSSRLIDLDFPESAEKEHMRLSRKIRVWLELAVRLDGAENAPWGRVEALKEVDAEAGDYIQFWIDRCGPFQSKGCDMAEAGRRLKKATLANLLEMNAKVRDQLRTRLSAERAAGRPAEGYEESLKMAEARQAWLELAQKAFQKFRTEESTWQGTR